MFEQALQILLMIPKFHEHSDRDCVYLSRNMKRSKLELLLSGPGQVLLRREGETRELSFLVFVSV